MLKFGQILLTSGTDDHIASVYDAFLNLQAKVVDVQDLLGASMDDGTWIFVDWLLPMMAGLQLVRLLRESPLTRRARISMVLPEADPALQARAIAVGADDYMLGPLTPGALVERMRTYRGIQPTDDTQNVQIGELVVNVDAYSTRYRGKPITLKTGEFRLLAHFAANPNRVFTRSQLIGVLGKSVNVTDERTVDVWVSRLRSTLKSHGVPYSPRTVRAFGYIMDFDTDVA
ncbi:response regulator transcription factor [Novosphingobium sp. 9]|uniref:response regulator transcription factor n=1 Tax=Novosphingobium sp. 9 TaxID=2025349 RepID=UPI0021B59B9E|nr:response regulator transcription factor [Novosphingobium sp. 9]